MNDSAHYSLTSCFATSTTQIFLFIFLLFLSVPLKSQDLDVPYVPTPQKVVDRMLDIADVHPSDYIIDLGSGDGRIVIAAAKRGASGHGVELDPKRITEARENAKRVGVDEQIMFKKEDIFKTDFSKASVVTMYLLPLINKRIRPELFRQLTPGTKIISHSFDMGDWKPDKQDALDIKGSPHTHNIFYWVIPADVKGGWQWSVNDKRFIMEVDQHFQKIKVTLSNGNGRSFKVTKANLKGRRITFRATRQDENYIFSGRANGNTIEGIVQYHNKENKKLSSWTANRR